MRNHTVKKDKVNICISATAGEQKMFNSVRKELKRSSNADVIRYLITQEYERISFARKTAN